MNTLRAKILKTTIIGVLCFGVSPSLRAADGDSQQVLTLFSQAKSLALDLREDTSEMEYFVANRTSWETQFIFAERVTKDVLAARAKVDELDKARIVASEWQRNAIDGINPLMRELVATTRVVVTSLDKKPFDKTEYYEYVKANRDHAEHLVALISAFVDYGHTRLRLEKEAEKIKKLN